MTVPSSIYLIQSMNQPIELLHKTKLFNSKFRPPIIPYGRLAFDIVVFFKIITVIVEAFLRNNIEFINMDQVTNLKLNHI